MEIAAGDTWEDITDPWVFGRDGGGVVISGGQSDQAQRPAPGRCDFEVNNQGGRFSPRNPLSPYYGLIGRNTPARVALRGPGRHMAVPDTAGARAYVPSSAALNVTADLDVRVDVALDRLPAQWPATATLSTPWSPAEQPLIGRYLTSPGTPMWALLLGTDGTLTLRWYLGSSLSTDEASTEAVPYVSGGRFAARATLDVDNGTGEHVVTFYTAPSLAGPWAQLGEPVTVAGSTAIDQTGSADLRVGDVDGIRPPGAGRWYAAEVRDGIGGTVLADPDFTVPAVGAGSFADDAGRTWTLEGGAAVTDWYTRFTGEIPAWPSRWDTSGQDVWIPVRAAGILRRYQQRTKPLQSALLRAVTAHAATLAYWPLEDGADATQAASALAGGPAAAISGLEMGAVSSLPSSADLPQIGTSGATLRATLPALPDPSIGWRAETAYLLDEAPAILRGWWRVATSGGGIARITGYIGGGEARIRLHDGAGTIVAEATTTDTDALAAAVGRWCRVRITAAPSGGTWTYTVRWTPIGESQTWSVSVNVAGFTRPVRVDCVWNAEMAGMALGHVTLVNDPATSVYGPNTGGPDTAFAGERATTRLQRLAEEEGVPMSVAGIASASAAMGPQRPARLMDLIWECVEADGGLLSERRTTLGLQYRARHLLYNQPARMVLDYAQQQLAPGLQTEDDDDHLANDVTVSRVDGSSARAVLGSGALSVLAPPLGVGLYDHAATVNVASDTALAGIAGWLLHLGTWDEPRYPLVRVDFGNERAAALIPEFLELQSGDRIEVTNPPVWLPPGVISVRLLGFREDSAQYRLEAAFNCAAAGPWTVATVAATDPADDAAPVRVATDGCELYVGIDETETALVLQTGSGTPWATSLGPTGGTGEADDFPIRMAVGGETIEVSALESLAWDDFSRSVSNSWGTSPTGQAWFESGGAASDRSVNGSEGLITLASSPTTIRFQLVPFTLADTEVLATLTPSQLAAGASFIPAVILRVTGSTFYQCRIRLATSGAISMDVTRVTTVIGSAGATPYTYTAGTALGVRVRVDGHRVRGRVWPTTLPEPGGWWVDQTVVTSPIDTGLVGVAAAALSGNTNVSPQFGFDDFEITNPQFCAVTRSINGIVKEHAAGAPVELADPAVPGL
ncbi:hypothetical protein D7231_31785 [Streptomyces klenkii]|uniref:Uncharacterized protein n=1 Tax=Streptomyces klenkii TaxID=1420899 RepID=A0A3B0AR66_9ACTN|nr:hypothetical protein D7231_31785 [Streptomyces klenkii]